MLYTVQTEKPPGPGGFSVETVDTLMARIYLEGDAGFAGIDLLAIWLATKINSST